MERERREPGLFAIRLTWYHLVFFFVATRLFNFANEVNFLI